MKKKDYASPEMIRGQCVDVLCASGADGYDNDIFGYNVNQGGTI